MVSWVQEQLATLEAVIDPNMLLVSLREQSLFPEVDDLQDPLGEPPERGLWY
jgi:hypothetical protein